MVKERARGAIAFGDDDGKGDCWIAPVRQDPRRADGDAGDEDERRRLFIEGKRAAQANRQRMRGSERDAGDARDQRIAEPCVQNQHAVGRDQFAAFVREQRQIARDNRARAEASQRETAFLQESVCRKPFRTDEDEAGPSVQNQHAVGRDQFAAFVREQRQIAQDNRARAEAADRESACREPLQRRARNRGDDDPPAQNKEAVGADQFASFVREQRQIARENRARAEAEQRSTAFLGPSALNQYAGGRDQFRAEGGTDFPRERAEQKKQAVEGDQFAAFVREQRQTARENRARAEAAQRGTALPEDEMDDEESTRTGAMGKKRETGCPGDKQLNACVREQRQIARENKAQRENRKLPSEENDEFTQGADTADLNGLVCEQRRMARQKKAADVELDEIHGYMREQRQIARANRARDQSKDSPPSVKQPTNEKKSDMDLTEINAFMREQRHAREANRARAEAELANGNLDDYIAEAERQQGHGAAERKPENRVRAEATLCSPPKSKESQLRDRAFDLAETAKMQELFRQKRDGLRLNRDRIRKASDGSCELVPPQQPEALEEIDLSLALNRRSASKFLKPHATVLNNLHSEDEEPPPRHTHRDKTISRTNHAEAMCAVLEREMGIDKLIALKEAANDGGSKRVNEVLRGCDPHIAVLAQDFLFLDSDLEVM
jgi:hypothetical protein